MAARYNTAEGAATGSELAASGTGSGSGDAFDSITKTGTGPSLQATTSSPISGSRSYLLVTGTATDGHVTVGWNESTAVTNGGLMLSGAISSISGSITLMAIRGSSGQMAELQLSSTGVVTVVDVNRSAVYTSSTGLVPTNGTAFTIRLDVDPGTGTTDGKARLWVWVAGALSLDTEVTGKNLYRSGGITARRWGGLDVSATTGYATLRVDELHTINTYASGTGTTAAGALDLTGSASVGTTAAATGAGAISLTAAARAARDYDIVVLVGQSNMRGAAQDYDAGGTDAYPSTVDVVTWSGNSIAGVKPAVEPLPTRDAGTGMGAGNSFIKRWANEKGTGRRVLIINAARGGTGFTLPSSGDDTSALWDVDVTNDSHNLGWTTITAVQDALVRFPGSSVVAFLANHGSTDGTNGLSRSGMKAKLERWIDTLRAQLSIPTVPYLMMQMRPDLIAAESNMKAIDDAQIDVVGTRAHTAHGTSPNSSTYWVSGSSVHFNAAGDRLIGSGLYDLLTTADSNGAAVAAGTFTVTGAATPGSSGTASLGLLAASTASGVAAGSSAISLAGASSASGAGLGGAFLGLTAIAVANGSATATAAAALGLTADATAQGVASGAAQIGIASDALSAGVAYALGVLGLAAAATAGASIAGSGFLSFAGMAAAAGTTVSNGTFTYRIPPDPMAYRVPADQFRLIVRRSDGQ